MKVKRDLHLRVQKVMIVSRSRTIFPPHPDLVGSTSLNSCDLKFLM